MDGQRTHAASQAEEEDGGQQFCALQIHAEPRDCLQAMGACFAAHRRPALEQRIGELWGEQDAGLAGSGGDRLAATPRSGWGGVIGVLSVRSGLHLLLSTLALPRGSEVLMSALNIPDVPAIMEHHGLVCVPVDLDLDTLGMRAELLTLAVTSRTRAILVAHVYGARADLDEVGAFAAATGLMLWEDCAEAFDGLRYKGYPLADLLALHLVTPPP
ncbi:DegT/DnrJ/EryC1/StrS aminotransferase family-domain-containing protein [Baffinella frigidus]|nr:DegT/DnrJ/EryC1/StrS aminotransferase family-domain-containing protein [Cryptophyta sp. CCMP2293]